MVKASVLIKHWWIEVDTVRLIQEDVHHRFDSLFNTDPVTFTVLVQGQVNVFTHPTHTLHMVTMVF